MRISATVAFIATALVSVQANATLLLNTAINSDFGVSSTDTNGNDVPNAPNRVYFGQLEATSAGFVDFFYVGNEAGYVNTLWVGGDSHSAYADTFAPQYDVVGSLSVAADSLLDFGFCTSGGNSLGVYGRCAQNDDADSLIAQFNYPFNSYGYRSIAFAALSGFDSQTGLWSYANPLNGPTSNLWMILWDDSGARNDDNHDDYVAIARFRPLSVPEPGTVFLLGIGLLVLGSIRRRSLPRCFRNAE